MILLFEFLSHESDVMELVVIDIIVALLECLETDLSSSPGQWSGYTCP